MKELSDYIRGYGKVPLIHVIGNAEWKVLKVYGYDNYYFMHKWELLDVKHVAKDSTEALVIKHINRQQTPADIEKLHSQEVYKAFKHFYKENTGKDWTEN